MVSSISSGVALVVSVVVAWLTFFRRNIVKMTQPTVIAFEYTSPPHVLPSVFLSALLFATPKRWPETRAVRGRVIESMYLKLSVNGNPPQNFPVWYYGNVRSGLFVGEAGVAEEHRFFTSNSGRYFRFTEGSYKLEVFARLVGDNSPRQLLHPITLKISSEMVRNVKNALKTGINASIPQGVSLQFNWDPESGYFPPEQEQTIPSFQDAPDYGEPALNLPNGEANEQNWMLYRNQRDAERHGAKGL